MNTRGPCSECGSPLAFDQRYCIECGTRVGPPLAMPYVPATPAEAAAVSAGAGGLFASLPMPIQTATTFAALALGFGVIVGTAISPNLTGTVAGPLVVQAAPVPVEPPPAPEPQSSPAPAPAPAPAPTPVAAAPVFSQPAPSGGGGGSTKEPKERPPTLTGTVIHQNPVARSYTITPGGGVSVIHTTKALPALGSVVKVPVRDLANRTSAEDGKRKVTGQATRAAFTGVVTFNNNSLDPAIRDTYTVSNRATSILVHGLADPNAADAITGLKPPGVGAVVRVSVEIKDRIVETPGDPQLFPPSTPPPVRPNCPAPATPFPAPPVSVAKALYDTVAPVVEAQPSMVDSVELATVVQGVCENQLLGSADDIRESGVDLFSNPATGDWLLPTPGVAITGFTPGQALIVNLALVDDPAEADPEKRVFGPITGIRNDTGIQGADDSSAAQGDLRIARRAASR